MIAVIANEAFENCRERRSVGGAERVRIKWERWSGE
jgi:hypothetical protein